MAAFAASLPFSPLRPIARISSLRPRARRALPRTMRRARVPPRMDSDGGTPDGGTITAALELTFRAVWVELLTSGVGRQYAAAIEQFVVACVAAYKAGYSLTALKLELATNEATGSFMGRDVRLSEKEKDTRVLWICLVYLTLARFRFASDSAPPPVTQELAGTPLGDIARGLAGLVENVVDAARRGYTIDTYKLELSLADQTRKDQSGNKREMTPAEQNLRSQWTRIVFSTIGVLPDSLKGFKK